MAVRILRAAFFVFNLFTFSDAFGGCFPAGICYNGRRQIANFFCEWIDMRISSKSTTSTKSIWHSVLTFFLCLGMFIAFACFFSALWYVRTYGDTGFDSILFTLFGGLNGTQPELIQSYLLRALLPSLLCGSILSLLLFFPFPKLKLGKWQIFPVKRVVACILSVVFSLGLVLHAAFQSRLVDYAVARFQFSSLYEDLYKDPAQVDVQFPEEKRNLVYILLESMETSYLSKEQGGALDYDLIPELYALAQNNINFSHNDTVGGFLQMPGASWTIGSMVAQTSGVPLKTPDGISDWQNGYGKDGVFLPGITTMMDILDDNGYNQALMVGSDANFGGRYTYYDTHGTDNIYDIYTARRDGIVPPGYFVWWGMEDLHLFDYAKDKLTQMAAQNEPFAFTMLTVDTHHIGGYNCAYCGSEYEETYENAISCSSKQVAAFVAWLQEQPFYENTTVVVTGDHYSMDKGYFSRNVEEKYQRHVYNCFLNSAVQPSQTKNRQFCAMDMFPTTLAAMGCTIDGQRLGLGTNLFSEEKTYTELAGYERLTWELSKTSDYYRRFYEKKP